MASKFRLAVIFLPVILGLTIYIIGYNRRQQAIGVIAQRTPPIYGIMPFSSIPFDFECLRGVFWIKNVKNGTIQVLHQFTVLLPSPLDEMISSENQIFGFQFPYPVTYLQTGRTEAKGWRERDSDYIPIEIVDQKPHVEDETSIIYLIFTPLPEIRYYDFIVWFWCRDTIIQETFSTYSLYIPIAETENNIFIDYFSNLNYSVRHLDPAEKHDFEIGTWLPLGNRVIEAYPPLTGQSIVSGERMFVWRTAYEYPIDPSDSPSSKVLKIKFENLEDVEIHDQLLFESGMLMGIGISNIITGGYAILTFVTEKMSQHKTEQSLPSKNYS